MLYYCLIFEVCKYMHTCIMGYSLFNKMCRNFLIRQFRTVKSVYLGSFLEAPLFCYHDKGNYQVSFVAHLVGSKTVLHDLGVTNTDDCCITIFTYCHFNICTRENGMFVIGFNNACCHVVPWDTLLFNKLYRVHPKISSRY